MNELILWIMIFLFYIFWDKLYCTLIFNICKILFPFAEGRNICNSGQIKYFRQMKDKCRETHSVKIQLSVILYSCLIWKSGAFENLWTLRKTDQVWEVKWKVKLWFTGETDYTVVAKQIAQFWLPCIYQENKCHTFVFTLWIQGGSNKLWTTKQTVCRQQYLLQSKLLYKLIAQN